MSIATRIGATNDAAAASIMSRCSGESTITTGRLVGVLGGEPRQPGQGG